MGNIKGSHIQPSL